MGRFGPISAQDVVFHTPSTQDLGVFPIKGDCMGKLTMSQRWHSKRDHRDREKSLTGMIIKSRFIQALIKLKTEIRRVGRADSISPPGSALAGISQKWDEGGGFSSGS